MGPRLFRRGNGVFCKYFNARPELQWGHVFSDVETLTPPAIVQHDEMLQWGHVFSDVETPEAAEIDLEYMRLQWGHVFSDVETPEAAEIDLEYMRLQWGHVFSDVETFLPLVVEVAERDASMGPRLFRRGNLFGDGLFCAEASCFNGATSFQTWKRDKSHRHPTDQQVSFNGATSFQTWKRNQCA